MKEELGEEVESNRCGEREESTKERTKRKEEEGEDKAEGRGREAVISSDLQ